MNHQEPFAGNKCFTKAGLAVGSTTTLTTANAQECAIQGEAVKKAATSNEATPTTDYFTGAAFTGIRAGQAGVFTICRNAAGDMKVIQGQIVDLVNGDIVLGPWYGPDHKDLAPIGSVLVKCATGASTWTFGSSNFSGPPSNVTFAFTDFVGGMPARPQAA